MNPLLKEIRHNPTLWLLAFVPAVFAAQQLKPEAHTLLFVLSVLAIVPLAVLLSHATESVAAKTGDTVGGLLNATLGNLTELIIALAALRAGQYALVKASIAGAIVTNTLFMLGASFLLGGLKHHVQEYNRGSARLQAGLLFLATVAMLVPSAVSEADSAAGSAFTEKLSVSLSVLLIAAYGLGLLFSLKTHRGFFGGAEHAETGEARWPLGLALATLAGVTVLVALVSEVFVESVQQAAVTFGMTPAFVGFVVVALVGGAAEMTSAVSGARKNPAGPERGHRAGERGPNRALRRPSAGAAQLRHGPGTDEPAILAGRSGHDAHRHHDRVPSDQQRALGVVCRIARTVSVPDFRHDALSVATPRPVKGPFLETQLKTLLNAQWCKFRVLDATPPENQKFKALIRPGFSLDRHCSECRVAFTLGRVAPK
jgi:Ca2+:H+ antiporter